ncbi:MAG: hypothetical protein B0D92_08480 [Spirochaeta sp. LUC14_002_19_P3]|nr:MAG: hypothetical protein B0D92_08480 [Spirochaeta sp. LUC14_002_19_P3]
MTGNNFQLFIDLDGVLADFDAGVKQATGLLPGELPPSRMWPILAKTPGFYDKLPWMSDGRELWEAVRNFSPAILTGLPMGQWAEGQKRSWCARELGFSIPVITGLSRKKAELAYSWLENHGITNKIPVLVDDRLKLQESWESYGGTFIYHLNTQSSLVGLRELGYPV